MQYTKSAFPINIKLMVKVVEAYFLKLATKKMALIKTDAVLLRKNRR